MVVCATWICCPRGLSFLTDHDRFVFQASLLALKSSTPLLGVIGLKMLPYLNFATQQCTFTRMAAILEILGECEL